MRSYLLALALVAAVAPAAALSQDLAANAPQRQAIQELEYLLNQPGVPTARAAQLQAQVAQLEAQASGNEIPALPVPFYGTCDADNGVLAYLANQLATSNLDYQQRVIDNREVYDLRVNLKQRGC